MEWIKTSEERPPKGVEVLVWSDRYGRTFGVFVDENKYGTIWKYHGDPIVTFNAPSHWSYLLSAPKSEP